MDAWGDAAVTLLKDPDEKGLANPYLYTKKEPKHQIMAQKRKNKKKAKKIVHKAKPKVVEEEKPPAPFVPYEDEKPEKKPVVKAVVPDVQPKQSLV